MKRLFRFFSFAVLTQLVLLLNQVLLLPIQLRIWGTVATASWYAAIAMATITTFADLGLRTAGHVSLIRYVIDRDVLEGQNIKQVWAWIRIMVCAITFIVVGWSLLEAGSGSFWKSALTIAYAVETLLIIRIVFLDSLGEYSSAESTYFVFALLRLSVALPALLLFRFQPQGLAWIFLLTSVFGITLQGRLCKRLGVLHLLEPFPRRLSFTTLATARYTMADPLSSWLRISLPVLVIASISTPAAVTIFVALRAVFSASRTTILQLARVASVEYLRLIASRQAKKARVVLTVFVQCAGFLGVAIGGFVIVDNLRILGLWLKNVDGTIFHMVAASFAFSGAFYAYQIFVSLMFRVGDLAEVASRQYAFVLYSSMFAAVSMVLRSLTVYLWLIVVSEALLAASFMLRRRTRTTSDYRIAGQRGMLASAAGVVILIGLWLTVHRDRQNLFITLSFASAWASLGILLIRMIGLAVFQAVLNTDLMGLSLSGILGYPTSARGVKRDSAPGISELLVAEPHLPEPSGIRRSNANYRQ